GGKNGPAKRSAETLFQFSSVVLGLIRWRVARGAGWGADFLPLQNDQPVRRRVGSECSEVRGRANVLGLDKFIGQCHLLSGKFGEREHRLQKRNFLRLERRVLRQRLPKVLRCSAGREQVLEGFDLVSLKPRDFKLHRQV